MPPSRTENMFMSIEFFLHRASLGKFSKKLSHLLLLCLLTFTMGACESLFQGKVASASRKTDNQVSQNPRLRISSEKRLRRKKISVTRNLYEGSLWRYESSFGNLLRDHRARFRGDLLTINELPAVVSVPEPKPESKEEQAAPSGDVAMANILLEALTMRDEIEKEQNEILRNLESISAKVTRVLPDGNMIIKGRKIDYRQRNKVRYITTVTGILRPADVDDSNIVSASKLANPNVQITRQQSKGLVRERLEKLAPLLGKQRSGLAGRLTDFAAK